MDFNKLMSMGKQAYESYQDSQSNNQQQSSDSPYPQQHQGQGGTSGGFGGNQQQGFTGGQMHSGSGGGQFGVQGGPQFNSENRPAQGGLAQSFFSQFDKNQVVNQASNDANEDQSLFAKAASFMQDRVDDDDDVDEQGVQQAHHEAYSKGNNNMDANSMGAAAAMQALKSFTSGGGPSQQQQGGNGMSGLIAMAMSEAAKLFNSKGGASNGDKQDVVNSAAKTMMKLMLKNKVSGTMGAGSEGGMGGLLSMASKFM
ncbi:uncharacterized protein JCM10292_007039 [Rhodotorula paludigena]|uniref:uncharacterized protein n=1 Tax=Rhodotorula paludigena TaxID=86838 RepID=UPI0031763DE5